MLQHLTIRNYALIEHLDIRFDTGLNILTGETGSGKSIILGALSLILGERADKKAVGPGTKKCVVEGTFGLSAKRWEKIFEDLDLDFDASTIFRREIQASGKSRAFINDTPVSLKTMRALGMHLVDIHSQHSTLQLNDPNFQLQIIDVFADSKRELEKYRQIYEERNAVLTRLRDTEAKLSRRLNELDFVKFQLTELQSAQLDEYDEEEAEEEYNRLANADEIARKLHAALQALTTGENSALEAIEGSADEVSDLTAWSKTYEDWAERLKSVSIEIADIAREMESHVEEVQVDPQRLATLDDKRAEIFRLERKHGVQGVAGLKNLLDELVGKVSGTDALEEDLENLRKDLALMDQQLDMAGKALTAKRKSGIKPFADRVVALLARLNMEQARFEVDFQKSGDPGPRGMDTIEMRFTSNAGHKPQSLKSVASGGELSRLMLAIKRMAATSKDQTLVLDEIDTGVSGEVAHAMGSMMREMGADRQVVSITHLPQIASKGQAHFRVYKTESKGVARTRIDRLDMDERIREIAQMLSGARTTSTALDNARELLAEN